VKDRALDVEDQQNPHTSTIPSATDKRAVRMGTQMAGRLRSQPAPNSQDLEELPLPPEGWPGPNIRRVDAVGFRFEATA
jgi:hypothetical protein